MSNTDHDDAGLDAFFAAARAEGADPGPALKARLVEEALALQPVPRSVVPARRTGWSVLTLLGGWPALTGLATATVAGIWIGVQQPTAVGDLAFGGLAGGYDFSGFMTEYALGLDDG